MTEDEILAKIQELEALKSQQPPSKFGGKYRITPKIDGFSIETDPAQAAVEKQDALDQQKKGKLAQSLEALMKLEATIPRKPGLSRFGQGASNQWHGFAQDTPVGRNIAAYQKGIDLFTPRVSRASGDTGNVAVAERGYSKGAFPSLYDDPETAEKKRMLLRSL